MWWISVDFVLFISSETHLWLTRPALLFIPLSLSLLSVHRRRRRSRLRQLQPDEGRVGPDGASAAHGPPRDPGPPSSDAPALQKGRGAAVQQLQVSGVPDAILQQG